MCLFSNCPQRVPMTYLCSGLCKFGISGRYDQSVIDIEMQVMVLLVLKLSTGDRGRGVAKGPQVVHCTVVLHFCNQMSRGDIRKKIELLNAQSKLQAEKEERLQQDLAKIEKSWNEKKGWGLHDVLFVVYSLGGYNTSCICF